MAGRREDSDPSPNTASPATRDLSRECIRGIVEAFENCTLPREHWTHGAHLSVGLWYVLHHGPSRAFTLMSEGIQRYNAASGRTPEERDGYDAATTRMWINRIAEFAREHVGESPEGTLFRRILTSSLGAGVAEVPCDLAPGDEAPAAPDAGVPITRLLERWPRDEDAVRTLFDLVYEELCAIAGRRMRAERSDHTLQPTALVHEAYARLVRDRDVRWSSRRHFFGAAAEAMRRVLVDHARYVRAERRRNQGARMSLTAASLASEDDPQRVIDLDDALEDLAQHDPRAAEVVRLRFFAGMSIEETASALELSARTVTREWTYARAWLRDQMHD